MMDTAFLQVETEIFKEFKIKTKMAEFLCQRFRFFECPLALGKTGNFLF